MNLTNKKIVCLGGGIGTTNLIKGLKAYSNDISVIISMADDGGSTGRLRRLYNILPPGDLVSCMAALNNDETRAKVLTYRFPGDRYGKEGDLAGHKLGNLIMVAMRDVTGDFNSAISLFQKTFNIPGKFFPATKESVSIWARTIEGKEIQREENIDLGKYIGKKILDHVYLTPEDAKATPAAIAALREADVIIAGPGDLYTTILPTLIVKDIAKELLQSKKLKIFVINIANKPEETKEYSVLDYINAVKKHLGTFPFDKVLVNTNFSIPIPKKWSKTYSYVPVANISKYPNVILIKGDFVSNDFALYHSAEKLAKAIVEHI